MKKIILIFNVIMVCIYFDMAYGVKNYFACEISFKFQPPSQNTIFLETNTIKVTYQKKTTGGGFTIFQFKVENKLNNTNNSYPIYILNSSDDPNSTFIIVNKWEEKASQRCNSNRGCKNPKVKNKAREVLKNYIKEQIDRTFKELNGTEKESLAAKITDSIFIFYKVECGEKAREDKLLPSWTNNEIVKID